LKKTRGKLPSFQVFNQEYLSEHYATSEPIQGGGLDLGPSSKRGLTTSSPKGRDYLPLGVDLYKDFYFILLGILERSSNRPLGSSSSSSSRDTYYMCPCVPSKGSQTSEGLGLDALKEPSHSKVGCKLALKQASQEVS
jgi:hypothetical protein